LLRWYDAGRRDLPWRGSRDAYAIWVSEVMLQQTRVETVRERWPRFLARFSDLGSLARATEAEVLKEWEGLGYYARARNLRRAARALAAEGHKRLPRSAAELIGLPGFGPYTAAAVASIAFGEAAAVVDGNVTRVLARFLGERREAGGAAVRRRVREAAASWLDARRPGDWNQALMDLGALVCVPRAPRCGECPIASGCDARARGDAAGLPRKRARRAVPHHDIAAGLLWRNGRVLIARRPSEGLLGGLWEFPGGKRRPGESLEEACRREVREETGLDAECVSTFLAIEHAYTHFRITLHLFHCRAGAGRPRALGCESPRFVRPDELDAYAFPRANRRAGTALLRDGAPLWALGRRPVESPPRSGPRGARRADARVP
jgi:A/G-specific adenine glycosylase